MKLLRHGPKGFEKPALLGADGEVRDLSGVLPDITPQTLSPAGLAALRAVDIKTLPIVHRACWPCRGPAWASSCASA